MRYPRKDTKWKTRTRWRKASRRKASRWNSESYYPFTVPGNCLEIDQFTTVLNFLSIRNFPEFRTVSRPLGLLAGSQDQPLQLIWGCPTSGSRSLPECCPNCSMRLSTGYHASGESTRTRLLSLLRCFRFYDSDLGCWFRGTCRKLRGEKQGKG